MSLHTQLHDLLERVAAGLRCLPGATALYLFGSLTTPQADAYADIDLQLVTADFLLTQADWPYVLEHIQPIDIAWPITPTPDNTAFAILFQDTSYYHKLDIGLSAAADGFPLSSESIPAIPLWAQEPRRSTLSRPSSHVYSPAYGTIGHQLIEELIGAVRYVKARKRSHQFTSWRFMRSQPEKLLQLLHAQMYGWTGQERSLSTWDYKKLDTHIDTATQEQIMRHLDWSTPQIMDQNFYWFVDQTVGLYKQKAVEYGEHLPDEIIGKHLAFLHSELGLEKDK